MAQSPAAIDTSPLRAADEWFNYGRYLRYENERLTIEPDLWHFMTWVPYAALKVSAGFIATFALLWVLSGMRETWVFILFCLSPFVVIPFGLVYALVGRFCIKRVVMDKSEGIIFLHNQERIAISTVTGIQVICGGYWEEAEERHKVYEMNLLLPGGSRSNIIAEGNVEWIREGGKDVAIWLGVPFYDHIGITTPSDHALNTSQPR